MSNLDSNLSKDYVKSIVKLKILNNSKILDFSSPNKGSLSTNATPINKLNFDRFYPVDNFTSKSKETRISKATDSHSLKSRLTQSYKSLSVETNHKVKTWKSKELEKKNENNYKKEGFLQMIEFKRKKSENNLNRYDNFPNKSNNDQIKNMKIDSFYKKSAGSEKNSNKISKISGEIPAIKNNKTLKKINSNEYAEKIIVNIHTRMDSFAKTYDNISQKLNKMIIQVKETDAEKEMTLSSYTKQKRANLRYEQNSTEKN